jgi:cyclic beta-1,2-glucan synthetase
VGFYLIERGRVQLEQRTQARRSALETVAAIGRRFPFLLYSGSILLLTVVFAWFLTAKAQGGGMHGWLLGLVGLLALLSASHLAVALINWLATLLATPRPLPRMDFSKGIPQGLRTLVVVPTMLTSEESIGELVEALEVRFLANRDEHLHFGLLTDFCDSAAETVPEDEPLLRWPNSASKNSMPSTPIRPATPFSSFIARAAGMPRTGSGWATSVSAASWPI